MATNNIINLRASGVVTYDAAGSFTASTLTQHSTLVGGASNIIVSLGVATNGQLVIGSTGAQPVLAALTPGTGIGITNAAGSITIDSVGGGLTWTDITGGAQAIAVNNGYTANLGSLVTFTLPASSAYGSVVEIVGKGVGLWKIAQGAGHTIHYGAVNTTPGAGGSISAILQYDTIKLLCTVVDAEWTVIGGVGNHTIV
jgi:hypothetical protein